MKFKRESFLTAATLAVALVGAMPSAAMAADERESLEALRQTTLGLIEALVEQGVLTREKADAMLRNAQQKAAATATADAGAKEKSSAPGTVRVPYVPEVVKNEIREQLKQEVLAQAKSERWAEPNTIPSWLDSIKWEGDVRVRYQADDYDRTNTTGLDYIIAATGGTTRAAGFLGTTTASPAPSANTTEKTERYRVRARLGMLAQVSDEWGAGVRLATGNTTDRVSTNQTLGQDWNKYTLTVDRAYITYTPAEWFNITAGRIPNPWFSTDLVWDEDLNFEGIAASLKGSFANNTFKPFLTAGAFPIKAPSPPQMDGRWMYGMQGGAQMNFTSNTRLKVGAAWYDFHEFEGKVEDDTAYLAGNAAYGQYEYGSGLRQKGNTLFRTNSNWDGGSTIWGLASRFRPFNVTASLDLAHFDPVHIVLTGDWVKNEAFNRQEIARRTEDRAVFKDGSNQGYQYKLTVGMPQVKNARDWQVSFASRYLGSDAVVDAFTDSDFGLGGTNLKGYVLAMQYGIDRNASLGLRWYSATQIDSFSLDPAHRYAVNVLQADANVRF